MADTKHVKANIQALGEELALLPEVGDDDRIISTREAVRILLPKILEMQRKGYRLERIVERLVEAGLSVSASTLRSYLRQGKKRKTASEHKSGSRRPRAAPVPSAAATSGTTPATNGGSPRAEVRPSPVSATPTSAPSARS